LNIFEGAVLWQNATSVTIKYGLEEWKTENGKGKFEKKSAVAVDFCLIFGREGGERG